MLDDLRQVFRFTAGHHGADANVFMAFHALHSFALFTTEDTENTEKRTGTAPCGPRNDGFVEIV
jgi:hypothetical protein